MYTSLTQAQFTALIARATESFPTDIRKQNNMYRLPINTVPTLDNLTKPNGTPQSPVARMEGFLKTLTDEVAEGHEIRAKLELLDVAAAGHTEYHYDEEDDLLFTDAQKEKLAAFFVLCVQNPDEAKKDVLVDMADWLSDLIVYCRSEAMKYGLPLEDTLQAVMASNFTKLPADGVPVHDANGKFLKDMTNFVPPENAIKTILFGLAKSATLGEGTESSNT
jgi:hypothetical protein